MVVKIITDKRINANAIKRSLGVIWNQNPIFDVSSLDENMFLCLTLHLNKIGL